MAGAAVAVLLAPRVRADAPGSLAVTDLGAGLLQIGGAGANVVAAIGANGSLLVDGGSAQHSAALLDLLGQRGRKVEYRYLPRAHTDGDVAVFFPDANVLAVGALLAVGSYPVPDYATGGWIGGLEAATRALLDASDSSTKIVPASGAACSRAELEAQLKLCTAVKERVADAYRHGLSFQEFVATNPTQEFDAERGNPSLFLKLVHKGAWAHLRELGGVI